MVPFCAYREFVFSETLKRKEDHIHREYFQRMGGWRIFKYVFVACCLLLVARLVGTVGLRITIGKNTKKFLRYMGPGPFQLMAILSGLMQLIDN